MMKSQGNINVIKIHPEQKHLNHVSSQCISYSETDPEQRTHRHIQSVLMKPVIDPSCVPADDKH